MAYDESGNRIWYNVEDADGSGYALATIPGVGVYHAEKTGGVNGKFALRRMDLVAGGFRDDGGVARFPMTDAQGNVRGYATTQGIQGAYDYYPYGTVVDLQVDGGADDKRWQDKEFDGEHGKYYFGARYFDPFFALWMSPDPAGQFSNPYTYGGDPVNFVDPNGMMAFGAGIVYGYDSEHGWNVGFGLAAQMGDDGSGPGFNTSFTWSADGSWNANVGGSGALPLAGALELNGGLSYSYNSRSGHALSARAGVCAGSSITACAGAEIGWNLYWNNGSFTGASAYAGLYESALGGLANLSSGYEWGIGSEGRGVYASASVAGATVGLSQNGGFSYGFEEQVYYKLKNDGPDPETQKPRKYVGLSFPSLGVFADMFLYDHGNRNDNPIQKDVIGKDRDAFEAIAKEKGMKSGHYSALGSALHEPHSGSFIWDFFKGLFTGNSPKSTVDKMWMQDGDMHWWQVPAVEGLFTKDGKYYSAPSYNYGNNLISHSLLDVVPYFVFDKFGF